MTIQQKFQGSACFLPIIGQLSAMDITKLYCDWSKDDQKVGTFCYIVFIQGVPTQTFILHFALAGRNMQASFGLKVIWES